MHTEEQSVEFSALLGRTFTYVGPIAPPRRYANPNDDVIEFRCGDGTSFLLYHAQDCCESVYLDFAVGEWSDLVGEPILRAEESFGEHVADEEEDPADESGTWTFYKLATRKGYVDLRWIGTSNGYYSERVDLIRVNTADLTPSWTQETT